MTSFCFFLKNIYIYIYIYILVYIYIYICNTRSFFKCGLTFFQVWFIQHKVILQVWFNILSSVVYSDFSFSWTNHHTKAEEPTLSYYLLIAGAGIIGFIPFPKVLALYKMQTVSYKIWTHFTVSLFYKSNHYTKKTTYFSLEGVLVV